MRRFFLGAVLIISLGSVAPHAHGAPLRVGSAGLSGELLPLWIAQDRGLFKKHGLDTEVITIQGGPLTVQALLSGSVQFHAGGTSSPMEARMAGANIRPGAGFIYSFPHTLLASAAFKTPAQPHAAR